MAEGSGDIPGRVRGNRVAPMIRRWIALARRRAWDSCSSSACSDDASVTVSSSPGASQAVSTTGVPAATAAAAGTTAVASVDPVTGNPIDPCALLTVDEVGAALQAEVSDAVPGPQHGLPNPLGQRTCTWSTAESPPRSLSVSVVTTQSAALGGASGGDVHGADLFEDTKPLAEGVEPIPGLGDDAFFGAVAGVQVSVVRGDVFLSVTVPFGLTDADAAAGERARTDRREPSALGLVDQANVAVSASVHDRRLSGLRVQKKKNECPSSSICSAASSGGIGLIAKRFTFTMWASPASGAASTTVAALPFTPGFAPWVRRTSLVFNREKLMLELSDGEVDGGELIGSGDLGTDVVTVALERDLAHLASGDPRVALFAEMDVPRRSMPSRNRSSRPIFSATAWRNAGDTSA